VKEVEQQDVDGDVKFKIKKTMRNSPLKGLMQLREKANSPMMKKGPCWKGYEMIGMKKKGGRNVPNCVPKKK
jgi:hypothetical protein